MVSVHGLGSSVAMISGTPLGWDSSIAAQQPGDPLLSPQATPGYPRPAKLGLKYAALSTLDDVYSYAWESWSESYVIWKKSSGDAKGLWETAGRKFRAVALMTGQPGVDFSYAKAGLDDARRTAAAARAARASAEVKPVPPPGPKPVPPAPVAKSRWPLYLAGGLVLAAGAWWIWRR